MTSPIVLFHGMATNAQRTWGETGWLDLLADGGRTVIAPDLLGHGTAPQPTDPAAYDEFEAFALATLPDEPVDAVGFSLGARTLLALAIDHPDRFGRIVVAGVGANLFRRDGSSAVLADALEAGDDSPMVQHFQQLARSSGQSTEALCALLRRPTPPEINPERLSTIPNEVLVVLGDQDFAGPADPLVEALTSVTFKSLRNVDHFATPKAMGFLDAGMRFLDV